MASSTENYTWFWTFVLIYLMLLIGGGLLLTVAGGIASYYCVLAILSSFVSLSRQRVLRIAAVIGTVLAIVFAIFDHEAGRRVIPVRESFLEHRLQDSEMKLREAESRHER